MINSCKKDSDSSAIYAKWNLVNDSIASSIGPSSHNSNYIGKSDDYYYFKTNDTLYIKEDQLYETLHYEILSNNKIIIDSISIWQNNKFLPSNITTLTDHALSIHIYNTLLTPWGTYERFINLSR
jgi:hypothetical protein